MVQQQIFFQGLSSEVRSMLCDSSLSATSGSLGLVQPDKKLLISDYKIMNASKWAN